MKKVLIAVGILILLGGGFLAWNASREVSKEKEARVEQSAAPIASAALAQSEVVKSGTFIELDAIHKGSGTARILKTDQGAILELGDDFRVNDGPDLFVYMSPNPNAARDKNNGDFASLGAIKSQTGKQTYQLPADYERFQSVVIWCRAFSVPFTGATLQQS